MLGEGFLGRPSTFGADLNLVVQLVLGVALLTGLGLARRSRFLAHGLCQASVLVVTLVMTAIWMAPAYHANWGPGIFLLGNRVTTAAAAHVVIGTVALALGAYVVLVAGTPFVPRALRFTGYKAWMRALIVLWWLALSLGVLTYWLATR
ncbi:MAG: hypothetical protein FJZ38_02150 [Candidatus Rokubacteria bacterium]|nr:hypothetical protein [Candidatus Rokubacteria bacterium]